MRIQITGSREFTDYDIVSDAIYDAASGAIDLDSVTIVSGNCPTGGDRLAEQVAENNRLMLELHPADWEKYGKRAGFIRNAEMIDLQPDVVLAFKKRGAGNKGTQMTIDLARRKGIEVYEYWED